MNLELKKAIDQISKDKGLDRDMLIDTLEDAVRTSVIRKYGETIDVEVSYNDETGDIQVHQFKIVVDEVEDPDSERPSRRESSAHCSMVTPGVSGPASSRPFSALSSRCSGRFGASTYTRTRGREAPRISTPQSSSPRDAARGALRRATDSIRSGNCINSVTSSKNREQHCFSTQTARFARREAAWVSQKSRFWADALPP